MQHESDKEWHMRRAFLLAHRDKFSDGRLRCLSSCYINVECYGCRYPNALMHQLKELSAELPKQCDQRSVRCGLPQPIKFVAAGQADDTPEFQTSSISEVRPSEPDTVRPQSSVNKSSGITAPCSTKLSELEASFHCLADKLKEVNHSKSLTESKSVTELFQIAVDKARMSATTRFTELGPGKGFRCSLSLDFVLVSSGEAQNKKLAKHSAYVTANELICRPFLRVKEDSQSDVSNLRLVASCDPFIAENLPQQQGSESTNTSVHLPPKMSAVSRPVNKDSTHSSQHNYIPTGSKRSSDTLHRAPLKDFVILQSANAQNMLQQSADFNKWPLEYDVSEMSGHCRCRAVLGGHVLSDTIGENKSVAKTAAADRALKQLASTCCTVVIKKLEDMEQDDTLKRSQVGQHYVTLAVTTYRVK